jgi:hypothetical protein
LLKSLTYSVTFPSTGRTLAGQFDFRKGFGTITGRNESGKSLVIEMVRYCLFSSAALRGKAEDYKKLVASLIFVVKGNTYTVNRKNTGATFLRDGDQIAIGTRPVNEKVVGILGFGLEVFDVACVASQGELEKLGLMKPTERKRMVDSVVGLGVIEDLAKWVNDQALEKNREVDTIERISSPVVVSIAYTTLSKRPDSQSQRPSALTLPMSGLPPPGIGHTASTLRMAKLITAMLPLPFPVPRTPIANIANQNAQYREPFPMRAVPASDM